MIPTGHSRVPRPCAMQQEEAASSSYASRHDLESPQVPASDKPPDLVASLVHVSRERKLPLTTTASVRAESAPTQQLQLQLLTQNQYVVPHVDQQHHLQVSQIATSPSTNPSIRSSIYGPQAGPALDNARLTEPFSPVYPLQDSELEERSPTPIDQCKPSSPKNNGFLNK